MRRLALQHYPQLQEGEVCAGPLAAARPAGASSLTLLPPWEKHRLDMQPGVQMKGRGVFPKLGKALPTQGTLATMAPGLPEPPSQRPQL